jgi:hypothetical protein
VINSPPLCEYANLRRSDVEVFFKPEKLAFFSVLRAGRAAFWHRNFYPRMRVIKRSKIHLIEKEEMFDDEKGDNNLYSGIIAHTSDYGWRSGAG